MTSHVQIAQNPDDIKAVRLTAGAADLLLACDKLVAGGDLAMGTIDLAKTRVLVNTHEAITGQFTRDPDLQFPSNELAERLIDETGGGNIRIPRRHPVGDRADGRFDCGQSVHIGLCLAGKD